jgi:hypothetical protein
MRYRDFLGILCAFFKVAKHADRRAKFDFIIVFVSTTVTVTRLSVTVNCQRAHSTRMLGRSSAAPNGWRATWAPLRRVLRSGWLS